MAAVTKGSKPAAAAKAPPAKGKAAPAPAPAKRNVPAVREEPNALDERVVSAVPAEYLEHFDVGAATGFETAEAKDVIIPRIVILQGLSPQLTRGKPEFIEEAQQADFLDTATNDLYRDELHILPCYFVTIYLEWAPRASGKGLVFNHGMDASVMKKTIRDEDGRNVLPNGNYIVETATWFVLNLSAGGRRSFIPLASTQLQSSRKWLTAITAEKLQRANGTEFTPPMRYRSWYAKPVLKTNQKGSWYIWQFTPGETVLELPDRDELIKLSTDYYEMAKSGAVTGDVSDAAEEGSAAEQRTTGAQYDERNPPSSDRM